LRRLIKKKGLTYAEGAELLGISLTFLNNLMRNKGGASLDMIYQIADKLNVPPSELFTDPLDERPSRADLIVSIIQALPALDEEQLGSVLRIVSGQVVTEQSPTMTTPKSTKGV
jgi:transcriptional regulator with XRE-family HTH domain